MLHSVVKAQRKEEEGWTFLVMVLIFPSNWHMCWGSVFLEMPKHLPANTKGINSLFAFAYTNRFVLLYLNPWVSLTFVLLILSPIPLCGSGQETWWELRCWPGSTHCNDFACSCKHEVRKQGLPKINYFAISIVCWIEKALVCFITIN